MRTKKKSGPKLSNSIAAHDEFIYEIGMQSMKYRDIITMLGNQKLRTTRVEIIIIII
jgi:hypothetical protein